MRNHSYENGFDLHENETACKTHFHMKGFALKLVLKQRHKRTWKWPIKFCILRNTHECLGELSLDSPLAYVLFNNNNIILNELKISFYLNNSVSVKELSADS